MNFTLLKERFADFLRTHRVVRHFRRLSVLDTLTRTSISRALPVGLSKNLVTAATTDTEALLRLLDSHNDGLSDAQAEIVRTHVGLNEVEHEKPLPWWIQPTAACCPPRTCSYRRRR